MSSSLSGKVALVTGASRGIGRATAFALAKEGAFVIVNYVSSADAAAEVVKEIGADRSVAIKADVSKIDDIKRLIQQIVEQYGKIDIIVLNAGLLWQNGALSNVDESAFDSIFQTNVKGPFFLIQEAAKHIPDGGRVLLFSTSLTAVSMITPNYLLYVATKGAVEQMTRVMSKDLGKRGITVNTISPGPISTDTYFVGKTEEMIKLQRTFAPANRIGTPEEVADVITFMASDKSQWINGQNIRINGGMTIG